MTEAAPGSRSDSSRARLLSAALEAFAGKGFHGTTTRDIAAAAGMSPAALYVHHKSKEELLYVITRAGNLDALHRLQESIAASDDPTGQVRRLVRDFAVSSARHNMITRVINNELAALSQEHRAEVRTLRRQIDGHVREIIRRGIEAGDFHVDDADIAATAVMSLGIDISRWYREGGQLTPEDLGELYADLALRMLGVIIADGRGAPARPTRTAGLSTPSG